jgi:DNA-binding transcriptional LysR family regulator
VSDLSPNELRVLVAVAEEQSFTRAGARLGMTQSAVSHAVRGSERKLGAVLFERGRQGARATEAGLRASTQARHVLRLLDSMGSETRGAAERTVTGTVRIDAFRSAAAGLLPAVLDRLAALHPGLHPQVSIVRDVGRGSAGEVLDAKADLGITTVPPTSTVPDGLIFNRLYEERYLLAAPAKAVDPRRLPLLDWSENCSSYTRRWWTEQDWLPERRIMVEDDSVVLSMVAAGVGMAVMPHLTLAAPPEGVSVTDLGSTAPTRHLGYVTTPALAQTLPVRALIRELRAAHAR